MKKRNLDVFRLDVLQEIQRLCMQSHYFIMGFPIPTQPPPTSLSLAIANRNFPQLEYHCYVIYLLHNYSPKRRSFFQVYNTKLKKDQLFEEQSKLLESIRMKLLILELITNYVSKALASTSVMTN